MGLVIDQIVGVLNNTGNAVFLICILQVGAKFIKNSWEYLEWTTMSDASILLDQATYPIWSRAVVVDTQIHSSSKGHLMFHAISKMIPQHARYLESFQHPRIKICYP